MEKKVEVRVFQIKKLCDCGGEFISTGESFTSNPRQYIHECQLCHKFDKFGGVKYPKIAYEPINTENGQ